MIKITPDTAIILYLGITLLTLLGFWVFEFKKKTGTKLNIVEKDLLKCEFCNYIYLKDKTKKISQCPQCQLFNS